MPLTLASIGFFLSEERVAFLAVTPTERLLAAHQHVYSALPGLVSDLWPHYAPGTFVPHCTLAMRSPDAETIVGAVSPDSLPIPGVAQEIHLVEISTGSSMARLA
jgi:2'-5' RNA ligase